MPSVLIVDDSRLARQELKQLLSAHPELHPIREAGTVSAALKSIAEHPPELILLDIQLPGKTGFDLLDELETAPPVIFTTAYDEYAVKAFERDALDYLLKPIHPDRLSHALEKVKAHWQVSKGKLTEDRQIFLREEDRCWLVELKKIWMFEIEGNYTRVYFEEEKPLIYKSLKQIESRLPVSLFFRINRQQIINIRSVERVETWFSHSLKLYLKGGTEVEVSRRQAQRLRDMLSL